MQDGHGSSRPDMKYVQMDATEMSFEDGQFSVVLDKGTLDALMPDDSREVDEKIRKLFDVSTYLKLVVFISSLVFVK